MRSLFRTARAAAIACLALTAIAPAPAAVAQAAARAATARSEPLTIVTKAGPKRFDVEVMRDDAARARGLMFRRHMAADHGMLFDFEQDQPVTMWMKNTYLPLDMIFVKPDGTILSIAENTTPLSEATVPSGGPVRFVFEVVAGTVKRLGIAPGDKVVHPLMRRAD